MVSGYLLRDVINKLKGVNAIGHTRYSTAGDVSIREAQPFLVACQHGQISVCHNGNLPFAGEERRKLEAQGAIFSSTSETFAGGPLGRSALGRYTRSRMTRVPTMPTTLRTG